MIIAVDFDGTCVTHEFPFVGKDIGAAPVLKELAERGHQLILYTMRSDIDSPQSEDDNIVATGGNYLTAAKRWFKENGIPLYGVQTNPTQHKWTKSPKAYAQMYIDDAALGCPLKHDKTISSDPFVDWDAVRQILAEKHLL
jgi:hypothetical protein